MRPFLTLVDEHLEQVVIVALFLLMTFLVGFQVFMRYVLNNSLTWSEELARYCFIWMTYFGVSYAMHRNAHIAVTVIPNMLSPKWQRWLRLFNYLVFILFCYIVMREGYVLTMKIFAFQQRSSSLGILMGWVYLAPVVGFALVVLRIVQKIFEDWRPKNRLS